ncbi:MAG: M28 family peptidase [Ferruginibacter sp.]
MKKIVIASLQLLLSMHLFAQNNDAVKYAATITAKELQDRLTVLASADMQGRETGTEGQRKAAAYIENEFKSIGLKLAVGMTGYQQFYPLYKDSTLKVKLEIGKEAEYGKDYVVPANNNETGEFKSDRLVFAGYGIEDSSYTDYASVDVKGKVVVMFLGEPKIEGKYLVSGTGHSSVWTFPGLSKKLSLAASKGAAGVLVINPMQPVFNTKVSESTKKTNLYYPKGSTEKFSNYAIISHEFAKYLLGDNADSLMSLAKSSSRFPHTFIPERSIKTKYKYIEDRILIEASNVIGIIEGTDKKDEYIFLTGHYDHLGMKDGKIYYGADDDGSGTIAVIQMAAAFAKAKADGNGPRRTLVFMTVSGEEKGLWGSEYYSDNPVYPLEKTSVDLNTDMVGRTDTERQTSDTLNYVYVVGHDKLSSDLPVINEGVNKQFTNLVLDYKFDDPNDPNRIYFRSDHYNFARKGVPVLFFYDGMLKADYHRTTDTIDKINWTLYEKRVHMIFHTAWEMANREEMLKRDIPLPESARKR